MSDSYQLCNPPHLLISSEASNLHWCLPFQPCECSMNRIQFHPQSPPGVVQLCPADHWFTLMKSNVELPVFFGSLSSCMMKLPPLGLDTFPCKLADKVLLYTSEVILKTLDRSLMTLATVIPRAQIRFSACAEM